MEHAEDALLHRTRRSIYNYIANHPGVSSKQIQDIFGLNKSTLRYHMRYLVSSEHVRCDSSPAGICYYANDRPVVSLETNAGIDIESLPRLQRRLLNLVKGRPGITKREMLSYLDTDKERLSHALKRLEDRRLIVRVQNNGSGSIGYEFLSEERLGEMMYKRLLQRLFDKEISEGQFLAAKRKLDRLLRGKARF